jgi:serine/threonine protein kinase
MPDLRPGTQFAGCRIEEVLGTGGMGVIYRATELRLGRPVALKLISADWASDPALRERFEREARLTASIDHPNVIPVYGAGEEDGHLYLVMRYVPGTDLHALMRRDGRLEPRRAAAIVSQLAEALDAAHAAGLVHRDVKPANVLLAGPHVYLGDFGLTRLMESGERFTESGAWVGTVDFMSPEHLRGEPCDARSDVYALGCVLFAALTGRPPFRRQTVPATMSAHLHEPAPYPSEHAPVPAGFDGVIARAMAKRPEDRYPSAGDLGRAALAAAAGEHVTVEERTVATGAAAPADQPTTAMPTEFIAPEPPPPPSLHHSVPRRGPLLLLLVAAVSASVAAYMLSQSEPGGANASIQLSDGDVRDAVDDFSHAIANEDAAGLSRVLARDVKRVFPADSQAGRGAVLATYRGQFRTNKISGYEISDLDVTGGRSGRAAGTYTFSRDGRDDTGGRIVLGVKRERGRAKVALIAADPG